MKVVKVTPRGYCKGVVRAINIVKEARNSYQGNIYILGMIVHNNYVKQALEEYHIISLDTSIKSKIDYINSIDNGLLIFTAHGTSEKLITLAKSKGLDIIDATCLDVLSTHEIIKEHLNKKYKIIYIGKDHHPEAEAVMSIDPSIFLLENACQIPSIPFNSNDFIFLTNQTTMSLYETQDLMDQLSTIYQNLEVALEVCDATKIRQKAIMELDEKIINILIIVGDPKSNNACALASINQKIKHRYLINSVNDIDLSWFNQYDTIAVSSGASTPTYLTNQVISYLENLDLNNEFTYAKPCIDLDKIL